MPTMISRHCGWCKNHVLKLKKEVDRQQRAGKQNFYCNSSCAANSINSRDHILEANRERARSVFGAFIYNPYHAAKAKYGKERWKYEDLKWRLIGTDLPFQFEYPLVNSDGCIRLYDLCLPERRLLIEFDGKYHQRSIYFHRDDEKDKLAEYHGWNLIRIPVLENSVIPASVMDGIL